MNTGFVITLTLVGIPTWWDEKNFLFSARREDATVYSLRAHALMVVKALSHEYPAVSAAAQVEFAEEVTP